MCFFFSENSTWTFLYFVFYCCVSENHTWLEDLSVFCILCFQYFVFYSISENPTWLYFQIFFVYFFIFLKIPPGWKISLCFVFCENPTWLAELSVFCILCFPYFVFYCISENPTWSENLSVLYFVLSVFCILLYF